VLVHRPDGLFKNDGADGELPDLNSDMWDYTINFVKNNIDLKFPATKLQNATIFN
jgi:hypothetical protein